MSIVIENGAGNANKMKVDANNRAHVSAVSETEIEDAGVRGTSYNINTGDITFSTANTAGSLLYFKNNETEDFILDSFAVGIGSATASDIGLVTMVRNPTGGNLISDATNVDMNENRNFGSNKTISDSFAYKGKDQGTVTGGNNIAEFYQSMNGRLFTSIGMVLPKGSSLALMYNPYLSSGTVKAYAAIIGHLRDSQSD